MKGVCCFCFYKHHIRMKVKKVLHLFPAEKFTGGFIYFVNEYSKYKHMFWVYGEDHSDEEKKYLKQENVKATFFITAHYINTAGDIVKRMIEEGHIVRKSHSKP